MSRALPHYMLIPPADPLKDAWWVGVDTQGLLFEDAFTDFLNALRRKGLGT